ncbi:hypothetical protein B0H14DRAFT_3788570 [Mycena olivaceomarginata]|nr:hypothetical protein B0H14DRAFT_3788570 [Mycena olivaceomarginata]
MDQIQTVINGGVFGWVNTTTTLLNDTIAGAYSDIQNAMTSAFGGTVLNSPIQDFIQCILGNKVDEVETALTFLQANLVINIPIWHVIRVRGVTYMVISFGVASVLHRSEFTGLKNVKELVQLQRVFHPDKWARHNQNQTLVEGISHR